jgi:hypothetical protein
MVRRHSKNQHLHNFRPLATYHQTREENNHASHFGFYQELLSPYVCLRWPVFWMLVSSSPFLSLFPKRTLPAAEGLLQPFNFPCGASSAVHKTAPRLDRVLNRWSIFRLLVGLGRLLLLIVGLLFSLGNSSQHLLQIAAFLAPNKATDTLTPRKVEQWKSLLRYGNPLSISCCHSRASGGPRRMHAFMATFVLAITSSNAYPKESNIWVKTINKLRICPPCCELPVLRTGQTYSSF